MLLYRFVRPFARMTLRTYFKKIYLTNTHLLPHDKPVILAVNHPTAFIEPCILATSLEEELHFLVRGDFFKKPIYNWLLRALGMLPVFRMKDGGFENLKNNFETFDATYQALKDHDIIMILAEGGTEHEKKLRPLTKGPARLAFGTMEAFGEELDIQIVPIGVNYTYSERFRSEVMIEFAEPIRVQDYLDSYKENKGKAIKEVTSELRKRLEKKVIIIEKDEDIELIDRQFQLSRNGKPDKIMPVLSSKGARLKAEKRISNTINNFSLEEKKELKDKTTHYFSQLEKLGVSDKGLVQIGWYGLGSILALTFGFLPFIIGYIFNAPPVFLANYIQKNKVKHIEFQASVALAVGMVAYPIWLLFLFGLFVLSWNINLVFFALILPLLGYFSLLYREFFTSFREARKASTLGKKELKTVLNMRRELLI